MIEEDTRQEFTPEVVQHTKQPVGAVALVEEETIRTAVQA